jgi:signal transduction histidine kinase
VRERLLAGVLPVRVDDLPSLAAALDAGSDRRLSLVAARLARRPERLPPAAPAFIRARAPSGRIEAWTRTNVGLLMYEVPTDALTALGGLAGRVITASRRDGAEGVAVPDVEDLAVVLAPDRWARIRLQSMRAALWIAIALALGGVIAIVRGVARESLTVAREKALLANITHELRSPLASIRVLAETLAQGRGNAIEYGALVAAEGQRLEGLVEQALTAARIDEAPSFAPVDPREIVASAVTLIRARADRRSVSINSEIPVLPEACWDGPAIRRALLNLLDNAVTHGRAGGHVSVSAAADGNVIRLSVADDGPGIGRRDRRRVFGRFVRGPSESAGTGLGLYVVEQVAQAHGGRVDLVSAEQRGCTFTLVLPVHAGRRDVARPLVGSMADGRL